MRATIDEIPIEMRVGAIETRGIEWGDQLVRYVDLPPGTDFAPLFEGLPDDLCACPHWGYVVDGSILLRYSDGVEELTRAGEVFYWRGGHTARTDEGVTFIELSPTSELRPVLEHIGRKVAAAS